MIALAKIPVRMSVQEFLAWDPGDGHTWQLVDGEPQAMAPANRTHGTLQGELGSLIRNHLRDRGSPCTLVVTPGVVPHVQADHNMRVPDLAVTCSDYETEEAGLTDPVLIVEILSPSNQAETWANVWAYTTIPSVWEIVVLRTVSIGADLLRRRADGTWPREPESLTDGRARVGRPGRVILHGKKREHGRDFGDFERKWRVPFRSQHQPAVCCVQSWQAMDNVLHAIPGTERPGDPQVLPGLA